MKLFKNWSDVNNVKQRQLLLAYFRFILKQTVKSWLLWVTAGLVLFLLALVLLIIPAFTKQDPLFLWSHPVVQMSSLIIPFIALFATIITFQVFINGYYNGLEILLITRFFTRGRLFFARLAVLFIWITGTAFLSGLFVSLTATLGATSQTVTDLVLSVFFGVLLLSLLFSCVLIIIAQFLNRTQSMLLLLLGVSLASFTTVILAFSIKPPSENLRDNGYQPLNLSLISKSKSKSVENVFTIIDSSNVSDPRNKKKSIVKTNPQAIWDEYGESSFFQSQYYWNVGYWINSLFRLNSLSDYRNFDVNLYFLNTKLNFDREVDTDKMVDFVSFRDQRHLYFLSYSFFINTHNLPTQPLPRILTYDNNGAFLEKIVPSFDDIKLDPPRVKKVYKFFSDTIIQSFRDYEAEEKERQEKEEKEKAEKDNGNGQDSNKVNSVSTEPNNKNSSDADSKDNNDSSDSQGKDSSKSKPKFRPRLPQFFDRVSINYSKFSSSFNTQLKHIHQGLSTRDEAMEIFKDKVALFYALSMAYDNFTFQKDSGIIDNTSLNKFKTEFNKKQKELTEKNKQKQDGKDQKSQRMTQGADKAVTVEPKAMQSEIGMTDQTNDQSSSETKDSMDSSDSSDTVDNTDESEDKQSEEEEKFDEEIENAKKMPKAEDAFFNTASIWLSSPFLFFENGAKREQRYEIHLLNSNTQVNNEIIKTNSFYYVSGEPIVGQEVIIAMVLVVTLGLLVGSFFAYQKRDIK